MIHDVHSPEAADACASAIMSWSETAEGLATCED